MLRVLIIESLMLLVLSTAANSFKYEKLTFQSSHSLLIEGKLWFPDSNSLSNIIVIDVRPCLETTCLPDSCPKDRYDLYLRQKMIEKGMMYFEFTGRKDSLWKFDRKYPVSTMFTKAEDLENAIKYLKSREDVKNREVFLIGMSEGGITSAMVASRMNVNGIILISSPGVSGSEFIKYQSLYQDSVFMGTFGTQDAMFDILNKMSSLKSQSYQRSYSGFQAYKEDMYGPMEEIIRQHNDYDTIAYYIMEHLKEKWKREDSITKNLHKNFYNYCTHHHCFQYIQPEQIAFYKWDPSLYYPKIKCPVLSIFGDKDHNVEYASSMENMQKMLVQGGNDQFSSIVFKGYNHTLQNSKGQIDKDSLNKIVEWILLH